MPGFVDMKRRHFFRLAGVAGAMGIGPFAWASDEITTPGELSAIAQDAYIWGSPLVMMQSYLQLAREKNVSFNTFTGAQRLSTPADKVGGPNVDTLYGYAWLDLRDGPQILHVPDTHDRYYSIQFLDEYTNTFAYIGRRATGTKEGVFAIIGPGWKGVLPSGIRTISSPTDYAVAFTRTLVLGETDLPAALAIQRQYVLAPLNAYPVTNQLGGSRDNPGIGIFPIPHLRALGAGFFDSLSAGLSAAPPTASDEKRLRRFAQIGIAPGARPSEGKNKALLALLQGAVPVADERIQKADYTTHLPGWSVNYKITGFIQDPLLRASVNRYGPGTHIAEEALAFGARPEGYALAGTNNLVLRFPAGGLPPVDAFWSLTLYGPDFFLVENQIHRYAISDRTAGLRYDSDGALEIQIQHEAPVQGISNWLPAPAGPYRLLLRAYQPRIELLNGIYRPPPLKIVSS